GVRNGVSARQGRPFFSIPPRDPQRGLATRVVEPPADDHAAVGLWKDRLDSDESPILKALAELAPLGAIPPGDGINRIATAGKLEHAASDEISARSLRKRE